MSGLLQAKLARDLEAYDMGVGTGDVAAGREWTSLAFAEPDDFLGLAIVGPVQV